MYNKEKERIMNSNLTVGPSFKGTFTFKTVAGVVEGVPVYSQKPQVIRVKAVKDRAINSALAFMMEGNIAKKVAVDNNRLKRALGFISSLIGKPLGEMFKVGKTVASGDILNPSKMTFELKAADIHTGDIHMFWESDVPYSTLIEKLRGDGFGKILVEERRAGKPAARKSLIH